MPSLLTVVSVSTSTAIVAAAGGLVLFAGRKRRLDLRGAAAAATAALAALGALVFVAVFVQYRFFLAVNFAYCAWTIALPLLGGWVLVSARTREVTRGARVLAWTSLAALPVAIDATFVEPYRLETVRTEVVLPAERAPARALRIAVLSDLQCVEVTDHERDAVARALAARPDLILLPGDFVQVGTHRIPDIWPAFHALVAELDAPLGVYAVQGDCETPEEARELFEDTRVRFLHDEIVVAERDGVRVRLCGVQRAFDRERGRAVLAEFAAQPVEDGELRLVVAHRPDVVFALDPSAHVDLVVAGHTHGGQVQIPGFGPPILLSSVPREVGAGGLHEVGGVRIYVSRGIGWEHGHAPRVRFLCRPEVSVLTLPARGASTLAR